MSVNPLPVPPIDVSSVSPDSVKSPTPPPPTTTATASNATPNAEASGSNNNNNPASDSASQPERSGSPPPSCPICLGTYKNKCFTDSCLHQFCFNCLLEWSKIKAECPLCKQGFKSIIHNVKSEREFEEYLVQQPIHYNLMLQEPFRFSYSTTLQVRPSQSEALQRLFLQHSSLTDRFVYSRNETPNVRRRIYERGLYALPLVDITGRARECSAEFYRNNQAQIHRLIPFLNREAIHVIQDPRRVNVLLARATEILTTHDITSAEFRRLMEPFFRENTVHFIHEFYNFARSPYDLYGYDNNVQYSQDYNLAMHSVGQEGSSGDRGRGGVGGVASGQGGNGNSAVPIAGSSRGGTSLPSISTAVINVLSSSSSSSSSSDDDEVIATTPPPSTANTATLPRTTRSESVSVIQSAPSTSAGPISSPAAVPGTSTTTANATAESQQQPCIKTEHQQRVESVIRTAGEPSVKIELSDTDSDVEFVLERKPPHLRTPEYVSLNSDADSDVVFVDQSTDGPVLPTREPPRSAIQANLPPSRLNLMEDSHVPPFMPYMYGMDVMDGGSIGGGSNNGYTGPGIMGATATVQTTTTTTNSNNSDRWMESKPGASSTQDKCGLKMRFEDPMLGSVPVNQKRKRRSQRHSQRHSGQRSSSDEDEARQQQNQNHALAAAVASALAASAEASIRASTRRRRATAQATNYAASSEEESDAEEAEAEEEENEIDLEEEEEVILAALARVGKRGSGGGGGGRRKRKKVSRRGSGGKKRKTTSLSPIPGTSTQQQKPQREESESDEVKSDKEEERTEKGSQQQETTNGTEDTRDTNEDRDKSAEIQVDGDDDEEEEEDNQPLVPQQRMENPSQGESGHQEATMKGRNEEENAERGGNSSSNSSNNNSSANEDSEDNDSNQGSVATSASRPSSSSAGSESEEIDVQNDEMDN